MPDNKSIAELIEELHQRYEDTVSQLSSDPEKWAHFLSKSSYNFRLRFDQQVLLYAQAPDATIVATSEQWYKMYRPIRANSKSIIVFDDKDGSNGRYVRYYEQSATRTLSKSQPIPLWEMKRGYKGIVSDALKAAFEDFAVTVDKYNATHFEDQIIIAAETLTEREIEEYYDEILMEAQGSELDELDDEEIIDIYTSAVANSVAFAMLSRLGYDAKEFIDPRAFDDLKKFNTTRTAAIVGTAAQKITQEGLEVISNAIRKYEREAQYEQTGVQRNDNARKARIQHGIVRGRTGDSRGHSERGAADGVSRQADESLVSVQRGTSGVRSDVPRSGGRETPGREILDDTQGLSQREEISDVRQPAAQGRAEPPLQRASERVHRDGNALDEGNGSSRRTEQRASEDGLVEVCAGNAEPQRESAGDHDERTRLQLTDNQEQTAENDDRSDSAVSVSQNKTDYLESETDRFYDYPGTEHIDGIYYNPDGNDGNGQYITVNSSYNLILEARDKTSNADEFFEYLNQHAEVYLADRGDHFFSVA